MGSTGAMSETELYIRIKKKWVSKWFLWKSWSQIYGQLSNRADLFKIYFTTLSSMGFVMLVYLIMIMKTLLFSG